ncbi:MAG: cell division protein ZipA C-terminal FtsZ-binding domain-containing protein [Pseudomonadota bacterium]|jgi:FtsZ-interacting cell division protein ZipA|nr:cell division protein ZipA C-terminal FtsZ-binding domain-containing protein [Pseudomonadota bacterium]MEC8378203.1 cell division protein ZipA C-terminal FtsZ-binding domain-containing protein [Pseudomonadota bacterium]MEC9192912.1 cell division protein ZipA C-terminal FtsZ-binding domain-containing protein [Pseudomonadota bacterium]|tara:strand:+ start:2960 stop:3616 length:657 start_codon:yes stop_codon:yes gene_type:complete
MSINEIIIILLGLAISVTLILIFKRIFFGKKSAIEINKKVNSRELFEPTLKTDEEVISEPSEIDDLETFEGEAEYDSVFRAEENSDLITIHLEAEEQVFEYQNLINFLESSEFSFIDEGGWFRIILEDGNNFMFVNGLNPGKFSEDENILSTSVMTLIYSMKPKSNSVNALTELIRFSEITAKNYSTQILDADRNILTQQMVEHYSQIAEEFDLNNIA